MSGAQSYVFRPGDDADVDRELIATVKDAAEQAAASSLDVDAQRPHLEPEWTFTLSAAPGGASPALCFVSVEDSDDPPHPYVEVHGAPTGENTSSAMVPGCVVPAGSAIAAWVATAVLMPWPLLAGIIAGAGVAFGTLLVTVTAAEIAFRPPPPSLTKANEEAFRLKLFACLDEEQRLEPVTDILPTGFPFV